MIALSGPLRRELVDFLANLDPLQSVEGRRAGMLDAGLSKLVARIDLTGAPTVAVGAMADFLAKYGLVEHEESLISLIHALDAQVGEEDQQRLRQFAARLGGKSDGVPDVRIARQPTNPSSLAEKLIGEPSLLPMSYLERALRLGRSVALIETDTALGTGFLVGRDVFLTNHHVLHDDAACCHAVVHFNFQQDVEGNIGPTKKYAFRSRGISFSNPDLDYAFIELEGHPGDEWSSIALTPGNGIRRGERVNIIQHPMGRHKQITIRNNFVEYVGDRVVQYVTHTEPGSSGSPVFDDKWRLVALHHAGGHLPEPDSARRYFRNEGILIDAILRSLPTEICNALRI